MTKNRKLFEEIDERLGNTKIVQRKPHLLGKSSGYIYGFGHYWCHW